MNNMLVAANGKTIEEIRLDFPMLDVMENGHPLIYLNSAATSLKPQPVLDAMSEYYKEYGVNVARGVDAIGYEATRRFEDVRTKVSKFLSARFASEIVFTRNTTEALNLVCYSFAEDLLNEGDEIIVSATEHHANYVPWQQLAKRKSARLIVVEPDDSGLVTADILEAAMTDRTKIVSTFHISNVLAAENDLSALAKIAHAHGAYLIIDGAQGAPHSPVDVQTWDVDFYAFSAHKMCGPTGIGVLYGKADLLARMKPWQFGGEMIDVVDVYESTFADAPQRFEAGTMPIAEVIGLGAAIDYIEDLGFSFIQQQSSLLGARALEGLQAMESVELYNAKNFQHGVMAYNIRGVHPHDAAGIYDREGISIRAGHHCNQPTMRFLDIQSSLRASAYFYNTVEEIDHFLHVSTKAGDFLDVLFS